MAALSQTAAQGSTWSADLLAFYKQLQNQTLLLVLSGLAVLGLALFGSVPGFIGVAWGPAAGLALLALVLVVWVLRRWSFLGAALALVLGTLIVDLALVRWSDLGSALFLLIIPVGLATLCVSAAAGLLMAGACTLLLLAPWLQVAWDIRVVALLGVWATLGMIWLTLRPLLTATKWAWSAYERSLSLLEQARDHQQRLHQTLEDLTAANVQLTRLNRLVDSLRQAAEQARHAKEEFVANVSHELRTPLNMIIGFSQMILEAPQTYGQVPPTLLADLAVIQRNSQHLAELIDDVLDLSRVDSGKMPLVRERVALSEIVEEAAVAVRPLFESKGLYLETEIDPELPCVYCDPTRIREVVLNLLSNAGRFTERGGVRVRAWRDRADVVVSVTDTGPGITPSDIQRLFEPFQQLDGSIRRRYGGTGLGLSISRKLIELHGGRMWMESTVGVGTTLFFSLPLEPAAPPRQPRALAQP